MLIDGRLDEPAWSSASPTKRFFEIYPADMGLPPAHTEGYFLYDEKNIYIGIHAHDSNPASIRSALVRRDEVSTDQDYVEILIDSLNSRRSALLFRTNPQGVETDGLFNEDTQTRDLSADFNFEVHTSISQDGWTAEFRIPLSTLRYQPGSNDSWNILIYRNWPRDNTVTIASAPISRGANCTLCFAKAVSGITFSTTRDTATFVPYVTYTRESTNTLGAQLTHNTAHAGLDAKWQPRPDIVVDITLSPDFSQIEADDLQLSVNSRFALSVVEKRPFFLEGSDLLATSSGVNAIYTRAFAAPDAAARITRRGDKYDYTALLVNESRGGSILEPGPITSQIVGQDFESNAFVGRYRLRTSAAALGTLVSARYNNDGSENVVYGADATWTPSRPDRITAQVVGSHTQNPNRSDLLPSWKGQQFSGYASTLRWSHASDAWYANSSYKVHSPGFRTWNGFVPQVGISEISADLGINYYPKNVRLTRISPTVSLYGIREIGGNDLGRYAAPGLRIEGPHNLSASLAWYPRSEDMTLGGLRSYSYLIASITGTPTAWLPLASLTASVGEGLDVSTGAVGDGVTVQAIIPIRLFNNLELRTAFGYQSLRSREPTIRDKSLYQEFNMQIGALWHFSNRLYLQALYQDSKATASTPLDAISFDMQAAHGLRSILLNYQTTWQTRYFVGLRSGISDFDGAILFNESRTELFAKVAYSFPPH